MSDKVFKFLNELDERFINGEAKGVDLYDVHAPLVGLTFTDRT